MRRKPVTDWGALPVGHLLNNFVLGNSNNVRGHAPMPRPQVNLAKGIRKILGADIF
jgi:hypothetical protein